MRTGSIGLLLVLWSFANLFAQNRTIPAGSKIYIEELEQDLDGYVKAEIVKKKVRLVVVGSPEKADYILTGTTTEEQKRKWHSGWLTAEQDRTFCQRSSFW